MAPSKHDEKQTDADSAPFFYVFFAYISLISASVLSAICNLFNQMRGIGYMPYTPKVSLTTTVYLYSC